jgi:hypothetical protein
MMNYIYTLKQGEGIVSNCKIKLERNNKLEEFLLIGK